LSGCVTSIRHPNLGFLLTPDMGNVIPDDVIVAADNGCFTKPEGYSDERYAGHLKRFPHNRTLFAAAPDVLGDHSATVERARPVLCLIRTLGLKAAFVAQDGWEDETTPWDECDAIFVGGSTDFKFRGGRQAVAAAKRRGKWAHMGRVNSLERLRAAKSIGCDSADGTFLRFGPDVNGPRLLAWLESIARRPEMAL
jgi:hypothetical protein